MTTFRCVCVCVSLCSHGTRLKSVHSDVKTLKSHMLMHCACTLYTSIPVSNLSIIYLPAHTSHYCPVDQELFLNLHGGKKTAITKVSSRKLSSLVILPSDRNIYVKKWTKRTLGQFVLISQRMLTWYIGQLSCLDQFVYLYTIEST